MNQQERLSEIITLLETNEKISQEELMDLFQISKDTARRDIVKLVDQGLVERYPGGISQPILKRKIKSYEERLIAHGPAKIAIAEKAQELVKSGDTIYLDVSTTVNFLASSLTSDRLLLVTNSVDNALAATQEQSTNQTYLLGGFFNPKSHILAGESVMYQLQQFTFDYAFIGAAGISPEGIYYSELSDLAIKKTIIDHSKKVCLLVDGSKTNKKTAYKLDFKGIDAVITETCLEAELVKLLKQWNIQLITVKGDY